MARRDDDHNSATISPIVAGALRRGTTLTAITAAVFLVAFSASAYARHRPPPTTSTTTPSTTTTTTTTPTSTSSTTTSTTTPSQATAGGYDISWPQCGGAFPSNPVFGIVGVSDGRPYFDNPCLASEYTWARNAPRSPGLYMSTADPGAQSVHWSTPGPKPCGGSSDDTGCAYNYGWNAADHAWTYATQQIGTSPTVGWWLDIETGNTWSTNIAPNNADIAGMIDYFHAKSSTVGIYSTPSQWTQITGGESLSVPNWRPEASSAAQALTWCSPSYSVTGGPVALVQYLAGSSDGDAAC
jgi:hypothetical protein